MAPRGFAISVGEMPMFRVVAVFAMRWVVLLVILWRWWLETQGYGCISGGVCKDNFKRP